MLHLCDQLGSCAAIAPEDWTRLLATARQCGWVPGGTVPPPVRLDGKGMESETWDGNYEFPRGQIVRRMDAEHLRFGLSEALQAGCLREYSRDWVLFFLAFFHQSFAICPDSPELRAFSHAPHPMRTPDDYAELGDLAHFQSS